MSASPVLVTGASGNLGRRVLEILLEQGVGPLVATTRTPERLAALAARGVDVRHADFDDEASLPRAFAGVKRVLLVSTDALDRPGHRLEQHERAIRACVAAGVEGVVYTSFVNAADSTLPIGPDHAGTELAIAASGIDFAILRNNLYAELLLGSLPAAAAGGQLVNANPSGGIAYVTREDCARVAAAVVVAPTLGRRILEVTGPDSLTGADLAELAAVLVRRPVVHVPVPVEAVVAGMVQHGLPSPVAQIYAAFDVSAARGEFADVTDVVFRLTGRRPQSVRSFLADHRAVFGA